MEKQPNLSWAHRTDLTVATSPELIPHQNLQSAGHRLAIGAEYMEKEPNLPWALRTDLTVATSPELIPHQNLASVEWDSASSPCADEMQTDSPSNIRTPVPEGRSGMEVMFSLWASCDAVALPWCLILSCAESCVDRWTLLQCRPRPDRHGRSHDEDPNKTCDSTMIMMVGTYVQSPAESQCFSGFSGCFSGIPKS